jgi:hypothetical protein
MFTTAARAVVLTNAHVAQYYLLADYKTPGFVDCVVRTGSPAYPYYTAVLLYISGQWVRDNANQITSAAPLGTGENDFALLLIDRSTNPSDSIPSSFPYLPHDLTEESLKLGSQTLTVAYPAGFLGGIAVQRDLYLSSAFTTLMNFYSFTGSTVDVISVGGSVVAQRGSSGGGVVSMLGKLLGIISTSSDAADTSGRDLRAITLGHINRSLLFHEGYTLAELLSGNLPSKAANFSVSVAPTLRRLLEVEIEKPSQ